MRNFFTSSLVATIITGLLSLPALADFGLGMNYYEKKDFEKAFKAFYEAAQYGDHDAQNNVGVMYYRGEHVTQNIPTAYAWMALAAQATANTTESDSTPAPYQKVYSRMSDADKKLADAAYKELLSQYSDAAINQKLTPIYTGTNMGTQHQRPLKMTPPKYPSSMLRQGKIGFVDVIYTIDKYGLTRDHVVTHSSSPEFTQETMKVLRRFQFEPTTVNQVAVDVNGFKRRFTFEMSTSTYNTKKLEKIVEKRRMTAEQGTGSDKLGFAYFLESIPSFVKDYELKDNPNEWYEKAATQGSGAASYFLGRNILYGNMCAQDNNQSMGWLLKAARAGIADAQYMLAIESFSGVRFEKNQDKGFYWLARAANSSQIAQLRYAWILATHPDASRRNAELASKQLADIDEHYLDQQSYLKTQAAVAAENGDFKKAILWQKKALQDAAELELPLTLLEQQLTRYTNKQPWREEI
ncbi:TonB family protein [Cellvibrio sp. UBA7661]|uniref:SEL1-like repeat protein n=1 Tax=Cellvibrio sp. UBA7661 TaxID=1946311 RepID=UPI002F35C374